MKTITITIIKQNAQMALPGEKVFLIDPVTFAFGMTKQVLLDFIDRTDAVRMEDLALKCHLSDPGGPCRGPLIGS